MFGHLRNGDFGKVKEKIKKRKEMKMVKRIESENQSKKSESGEKRQTRIQKSGLFKQRSLNCDILIEIALPIGQCPTKYVHMSFKIHNKCQAQMGPSNFWL